MVLQQIGSAFVRDICVAAEESSGLIIKTVLQSSSQCSMVCWMDMVFDNAMSLVQALLEATPTPGSRL